MANKFYLLCIFIAIGIVGSAQNPIPNKYNLGEGFTFTDKEKSSLTITGYIQPSMEVRSYPEDSIGDSYARFRIRRLRVRLSGDLPKYKISYRFQAELSGSAEVGEEAGSALFDAWVAYTPVKFLEIKFGQSSNATENREMLMSSNALQLPERSRLTSAFAVPREFGLFVSSDLRLANDFFIEPSLSVTNGDGPNVFTNDHGGFKYGGRLDIMPFGKFVNLGRFRQGDMVRELTPKLIFGFTYSYIKGVSSRRGEASGTILYLDEKLNESLPDYTKMGVDFLFKYRGFSLLGEWMQGNASVPNEIKYRVRNDGSISSSFLVNGVEDMPNYVKSRMILGSVYNIQGGYIIKRNISLDARYTNFDPATYSFLNNPTIYNRPKYYTIGLTKFFSKRYGVKVQASFTYVDVGSGALDIKGNAIYKNEYITNLIATLSF